MTINGYFIVYTQSQNNHFMAKLTNYVYSNYRT